MQVNKKADENNFEWLSQIQLHSSLHEGEEKLKSQNESCKITLLYAVSDTLMHKNLSPDLSSNFVPVSIHVLCWPGTGALSGTIVGTMTAPAVIFATEKPERNHQNRKLNPKCEQASSMRFQHTSTDLFFRTLKSQNSTIHIWKSVHWELMIVTIKKQKKIKSK